MERQVKNVNIIEKHCCSGCGACYNVCPVGAISMQADDEGFLYPKVDSEKCTNCALCQNACPALFTEFKNEKDPECYAIWANDELREVSSSGGIFSLVANYVLEKGGYVCGAAFDENFMVKHIIISDKEDLYKLRGSKYVQSDTGEVFKEIQNLLNEEKTVLFSGCPCQVAGLKNFLAKEYDHLITMDLSCHGVPSPKVWGKYLNEKFAGQKIKEVNFRDKELNGWSCNNCAIKLSYFQINNDDFTKGFHSSLFLRPSCGTCKWSTLPRQGDITMADFWGIDKYNKNFDDQKGTSLVLLNNDKAKSIFRSIKDEFQLCERVPMEFTLSTVNVPIKKSLETHPERSRFFKDLDKKPFDKLTDDCLNNKVDVTILGSWGNPNYGAAITSYAMQELLKTEFGLKVNTMNYMPHWRRDIYTDTRAAEFVNKYLTLVEICNNKENLKKLNNQTDAFLIGSDQLWSASQEEWWKGQEFNHYENEYYLSFVNPDKKKLSYATSFGRKEYNGNAQNMLRIKYYLNQFDAISVREKDGVDICKKYFDVDATRVLDPVFVVNPRVWEDLIKTSSCIEKDYIGYYVLDKTPEKEEALQHIKNKLNLDLLDVGDEKNMKPIEDFLYYIKNSKFWITDSFHGCCFAIIFKKPFICLNNFNRGPSRFESLFDLFNLNHRFISDPLEIKHNEKLLENIDYNEINNILYAEKEKSFNWLKNALEAPKENKLTPEMGMIKCMLDDNDEREMEHEKRFEESNANFETKINSLNISFEEKMNAIIQDYNVKFDKTNHIVKLLANKDNIYKKYYRYKFLSKVTLGQTREKYKQSYNHFKQDVRKLKKISPTHSFWFKCKATINWIFS